MTVNPISAPGPLVSAELAEGAVVPAGLRPRVLQERPRLMDVLMVLTPNLAPDYVIMV